jgi:hypothetical protein
LCFNGVNISDARLGVGTVDEGVTGIAGDNQGSRVAVDMRVRVYPGTDAECRGTVVDDFGETGGCPVDIGETHIADAARRWAVMLDTSTLLFIDSDDLLPE